MSVRFSVYPADLVKGDVVRELNGHTVQEIMLDGPSPHWVALHGPDTVVVYTTGPSGMSYTWKLHAKDRVNVMDW